MDSDLFREWVPVGLRALVVAAVVSPATTKFLAYSTRVTQFEAWGVPAPGVSVLVAGTVELVAVVALAFGAAGRVAALGLAAVMVVAMLTAGPNPLNAVVLLGSLGIVALGTGRFSASVVASTPGE